MMEVYQGALIGLGVVVALSVVAVLVFRPKYYSLECKTVVITGGSSGIGKASAQDLLGRGASVALLARREAVLKAAVAELLAATGVPASRLSYHVTDVTDEASCAASMAAAAAAHSGRIDVLVNSAGAAEPRRFEETPAASFEAAWRLIVLGNRNAIAAALPFMPGGAHYKQPAPGTGASGEGRIVMVSSQAGQTGLYGYTSYSSCKFALRGLFEALSHELVSRRIRVSLAFPPDTDTPGFVEENKNKPLLTRILSEASSPSPAAPQDVARAITAGITRWEPFIAVGFDGWMLATLTSGMAPAGSLGAAVVQVATMGLWRLVGLLYCQYFYHLIAKHDGPAGKSGDAAGAASEGTGAAASVGDGVTSVDGAPKSGTGGSPARRRTASGKK